MNRNTLSILSATALLGLASLGVAAPARAGDVSNAQLGCYVDTNAWDYSTVGECYGFWTPWSASNPSVAVYEVSGLPAGNYSFYWTDLGPGQIGTCPTTDAACIRPIRVGFSRSMRLIVVDNQTGASKTLFSTAYYEDGWN